MRLKKGLKKLKSSKLISKLKLLKQDKKEFKVALFADFRLHYAKNDPITKEEHLQDITIKGMSQLATKLKEAEDYWRIEYSNGKTDYYNDHIRVLVKFRHIVSPVHKVDIPIAKVPMKQSYTLQRDWLSYFEGINPQSYEDM